MTSPRATGPPAPSSMERNIRDCPSSWASGEAPARFRPMASSPSPSSSPSTASSRRHWLQVNTNSQSKSAKTNPTNCPSDPALAASDGDPLARLLPIAQNKWWLFAGTTHPIKLSPDGKRLEPSDWNISFHPRTPNFSLDSALIWLQLSEQQFDPKQPSYSS